MARKQMTVQEWRDAVAGREKYAAKIKAERATCTDPVRAERLRGDARANNRLLKQNRKHLAIAEAGEAARAKKKREQRNMGV